MQLPCPVCALYVPVLHSASSVAPMVQYLPVAQLLQPLCADSPAVLLYEPAGHSVTADEPKGQ